MLTAADLAATRLPPAAPGEGYLAPDVDDFLDAVGGTLRRLEAGQTTGPGGEPLLTPGDIRSRAFARSSRALSLSGTRTPAYDAGSVDALLAAAAATLDEYIGRARRGEPLSGVDDAAAVPAAVSLDAEELEAAYAEAAPLGEGTGDPAALEGESEDPGGGEHTPPPDALRAQDFLRELQYNRATLIGRARESLVLRAPDGRVFSAVRVEKTPEGLVVHLG